MINGVIETCHTVFYMKMNTNFWGSMDMAFTTKLASYEDMKECARVETEAMGSYCYLED